MKHNHSQSGFTLIELLLAAAVFTVVASFAAVLVASTARLREGQKQNQALSIQGSTVVAALTHTVEAAGTLPGDKPWFATVTGLLANAALDHGYGPGTALQVPEIAVDGSVVTTLYCAKQTADSTGKRLVKLTFDGPGTPPSPDTACGASALSSIPFVYLTDTSTDVLSFQVVPVAPTTVNADQVNNPSGLSLRLVLQYSAVLGGQETRRNSSGAPTFSRQVFQTAIERSPALNLTFK